MHVELDTIQMETSCELPLDGEEVCCELYPILQNFGSSPRDLSRISVLPVSSRVYFLSSSWSVETDQTVWYFDFLFIPAARTFFVDILFCLVISIYFIGSCYPLHNGMIAPLPNRLTDSLPPTVSQLPTQNGLSRTNK